MNFRPEEIAGTNPLVAVVDDDESVRESLPDLLREFGFATRSFSSAEEFLASDSLVQTGCLVLDIAMPGMTGFRSPARIEAPWTRHSDHLHQCSQGRGCPQASVPARSR